MASALCIYSAAAPQTDRVRSQKVPFGADSWTSVPHFYVMPMKMKMKMDSVRLAEGTKNVFAPLINRTCVSFDLSYAAARVSRPLCVQLLCGVDSTNKFPLTNIQAVDLKLRKQKRSLLINQFTLLLLVFWHGSQAHNQSASRSRCICRLLTKGSRSVTIDR